MEKANKVFIKVAKVFKDPLYDKARLLEGAGIVSKDKPLKNLSILEKAKFYGKKMTGKMPSKKAIAAAGAIAAGGATGFVAGKAMRKKGEK